MRSGRSNCADIGIREQVFGRQQQDFHERLAYVRPSTIDRVQPMPKKRNFVAIIDDEACMRGALQNLLTVSGYRTELFCSAGEFLKAAATIEAGCLIIDVMLGSASGLELSRQLQAKGLNFPTIFVTGSDDPTIRAEALRLGCVDCLHKPFQAKPLIEVIEIAIGFGRAHAD